MNRADRSAERSPSSQTRRYLIRVFALGRPYLGTMALCLLLILASTGIQLVLPLGIRRLFDQTLAQADVAAMHLAAAVLLLLFVVRSLLGFLGQFLLQVVGDRIIVALKDMLFRHLQSLEMAFHHRQKTGDLMSRLGADINAIRNIVANLAVAFVINLCMLIGASAIMLSMNWRLGLIVLAVAPLATLVSTGFAPYFQKLSSRVQDDLARSSALAQESLSGIEVVKGFARERHIASRYKKELHRFMRTVIAVRKIDAAFSALIMFLTSSSVIAIFWFGGLEVIAGRLSAGTLVAFLLYSQNVSQSIGVIAQHYASLSQTMGASKRVFELLDTTPAIRDRTDAVAFDGRAAALRFDRVDFAYRTGAPVLQGIDFAVEPGQTVALVGASGSGKTTLIRLLARYYDPVAGAIRLNDRDLRDYSVASLRRAIAFVSQDVFLFSGSVKDNLRFGRLTATDAEIEAAARAANAHEFIECLPGGYDAEVGERGVQLSGGQRQRLSIARALLKDAPILVLDEATSSIDTASETLVQQAIERLKDGRTIFIIAHRLQTVRNADRIFLMSAGRIVAQPSYDELIESHTAEASAETIGPDAMAGDLTV